MDNTVSETTTAPVQGLQEYVLPGAARALHAPPPRLSGLTQRALDARTHPAWTRLKFDELLAQQLSLKAHRKARAQRRAPGGDPGRPPTRLVQ